MIHLLVAASALVARNTLRNTPTNHARETRQPIMKIEDSPVLIIPGFGNADIDYSQPLGQPEEVGLEAVLGRRGFSDVRTLPCERTRSQ